jgi:hypothetical protein
MACAKPNRGLSISSSFAREARSFKREAGAGTGIEIDRRMPIVVVTCSLEMKCYLDAMHLGAGLSGKFAGRGRLVETHSSPRRRIRARACARVGHGPGASLRSAVKVRLINLPRLKSRK